MIMRNINVWITEKNYEMPATELTPIGFDDLVNHRVFDTLQDFQYTMMALSRASKYALEHGLACPADTKHAIKHIKSLPIY